MPIEFQPLSMMDLRSRPGEVLDEVSRDGKAFVVERSGQQKACLVPLWVFFPDIQQKVISREIESLIDSDEKFQVSINDAKELELSFRASAFRDGVKLTIVLPHGYPNTAPVVRAAPLDDGAPHLWRDGSLCIFGAMAAWNPGKHSVLDALKLSRQWLEHYSMWRLSGTWPSAEETSDE